MEVSHLRAVFPLCASTVLLLLAPICVLGALPTTVESQAGWLADRYAENLELSCPAGLSAESIATSRAEVAAGLQSIIQQPLTRQQLREVNQWLATNDAIFPNWLIPPDLALHQVAGMDLEAIRLYLSRPPGTPEQHRAIMAQAAIVFDALRKELAAQFSGILTDPEGKATGVVFGETFLVSAAATSPVSPYMKRLFTPAEIETLIKAARDLAAEARQDWDDSVARAQEEERAAWAASLEERSVYLGGAAAQLQYKMVATSYRPPQILTKQESRAVVEAYLAQIPGAAAEMGGK